jgi:hypothetical protein
MLTKGSCKSWIYRNLRYSFGLLSFGLFNIVPRLRRKLIWVSWTLNLELVTSICSMIIILSFVIVMNLICKLWVRSVISHQCNLHLVLLNNLRLKRLSTLSGLLNYSRCLILLRECHLVGWEGVVRPCRLNVAAHSIRWHTFPHILLPSGCLLCLSLVFKFTLIYKVVNSGGYYSVNIFFTIAFKYISIFTFTILSL